MKTVTQATFARKTTETFEWEAMSDVNKFGKAEVRDTRSGRRFMVEVA